MGFSTVDQLVNASSNAGSMQRIPFSKTMASVSVLNVPHSLWMATGLPQAGTYPTAAATSGRVLLSSTQGGIPYGNAPGGTNHLITMGCTTITSGALGTLILVDRIADINLAVTTAAGALTGCTGTSRMAATTAPGDGGMIWAEVSSALGATTGTTPVYSCTNQLGTTGSLVSVPMTASAIVGRSPNTLLWQVPSTVGSMSTRSIDSISTAGTIQTGNVSLAIVRALGTIPIVALAQYVERDFVVEIPNLPFIYSSACLSFIFIPSAAVTATIFGELRMCYN